MAINFPISIDSLTNPNTTDPQNNPSHAGQHSDANDAIEALEAKVGANGSDVTTSHDYKIAQLEANTHVPVTVTDSAEIDFTLTGQDITASIKPASIDEAKLDTSVNASLDLADSAVQPTGTTTLTNKRINPRLVTAASYTTDTGTSLNIANCDQFEITAQAGALKFNNPGGTPLGGQKLIIRIKDNGTARALTYDTQFRAMGNALPTTTVLSKTLYMGFIYNATDTKWDLVAVSQEA